MGLIVLQGAQIGAGAEPPGPLTLTTALNSVIQLRVNKSTANHGFRP